MHYLPAPLVAGFFLSTSRAPDQRQAASSPSRRAWQASRAAERRRAGTFRAIGKLLRDRSSDPRLKLVDISATEPAALRAR
jgi:hypothetical protein